MTPRRHTIAVVLVAAGMLAPVAYAQSTLADIELGYQWVEVTGNEDMYRTQLNDDSGIVLRDLTLQLVDTEGERALYDRFRIDASGFGGTPAARLRLTSDLDGKYSLSLRYMQFDVYSALPGWANPLLDEGVVPGLHTSDRTRDLFDIELEILPGKTITPIVGYRWNRIKGPRRTTYHVGQDEFRLASDLEETESELRLGLAFRAGTFRGAVIQGWREFEARDSTRMAPGEGEGVNTRPVLGTDVTMDDFAREVRTEAETPVTSVYVSGTVGNRVRLDASYVRADIESDTASAEMLEGSLVSFHISRFFSGLDQSVSSRTENPSWRGALRAAIDLGSNLVLDLGYESRHRELEGWALISSLYMDTLNFSGADPKDVLELVEVHNGYTRDEDVVDVTLRVSELGPFHLWAGWKLADTALEVSQDVAQISVPGGQGGSFDRQVNSYDVGAGLEVGKLKFLLDFRADDGDRAVVRTDFHDRSRVRGRIDWSPLDWLTVLASAEHVEASNCSAGIGLDADTDHWALDLDLRPIESLLFRLAWDSYQTDSSILIRIPQDFTTGLSQHQEDGSMFDGSVVWQHDPVSFEIGYSTLENSGTLPFELDRGYARLSYDFSDHWGAAVEFESNEYSEEIFSVADFDARRYALFVRWRR